jgi:hypothetical protein
MLKMESSDFFTVWLVRTALKVPMIQQQPRPGRIRQERQLQDAQHQLQLLQAEQRHDGEQIAQQSL